MTRRIILALAALGLVFAVGACRKDPASKRDTGTPYTAAEFNIIAREIFGPIYPRLAEQVIQDYQITAGTAVDAGAGPGYFAIALAKATNLKVYALDLDPEAVTIARNNAVMAGLGERIEAVEGNVQKMPFGDGFADLVVSRGSYPFWEDKVAAFREIRRILKPGGVALIGGGMGSLISDEERTRITELMDLFKISPPDDLEVSYEQMADILRQAGISEFRIAPDSGCLCGLWVEFRKKD